MRNEKAKLIHEDIQETRRHLEDHLDELENKLRAKLEQAKARAQVMTPAYHWRHSPIGIVAGAVGIGILVGRFISAPKNSSAGKSTARLRGSTSPLRSGHRQLL